MLWQKRSFTAHVRTERCKVRARSRKRGCERRTRRAAHPSLLGFHALVRCTTGGKWNRKIMPCMSKAAVRGFRVLNRAATSCTAIAGMLDGVPCLTPGACQNSKNSGECGTDCMSGLHAQASRAPPPPAAR